MSTTTIKKIRSIKQSMARMALDGISEHKSEVHDNVINDVRERRVARMCNTRECLSDYVKDTEVLVNTLMLDVERFLCSFRHKYYGVSSAYCFDIRETLGELQKSLDLVCAKNKQ